MFSDVRDTSAFYAIRKKARVPDGVEPGRQNVDQKAADELISRQSHDLLALSALGPVVLPLESDDLSVSADQAAV